MPNPRVVRHEVTQPLDTSYRLIPLTRGLNVMVDAADYEWLNQWSWWALWSRAVKGFYAARKDNGKVILMHRVILVCGPDEEVDHRFQNTLDNRRFVDGKDNLRKCGHGENSRNRRTRCDNRAGFKGVSWHSTMKKYRSRIMDRDGKNVLIGYFDSAEEAARAYDQRAKAIHGEFAKLNFQDEPQIIQ